MLNYIRLISGMSELRVKVKLSHYRPEQAWTGPEDFRRLRLPKFLDSRYMKKANLSALRTGHLNPQKISLVIIYVRGWAETMAIVWPGGLRQWEILMTPSWFFVNFNLKICNLIWIIFANHLESKSSQWAELNATTWVVHPTSPAFHILSLDHFNSVQPFFRHVIHPSFDHRSVSFIDHWAFVLFSFGPYSFVNIQWRTTKQRPGNPTSVSTI